MLFLTRPVFNILVIVLFLYAHTAVAADDAYLEMLEGEAEDLSLDRSGQLNKEEGNVVLCFDAIMGRRICAGGEHGQGNKDNCRFGRRGAAQGNQIRCCGARQASPADCDRSAGAMA